MLAKLGNELELLLNSSREHIPLILALVAGLWLFNGLNWCLGAPLNKLGILPRQRRGLIGIFFAPLLHSNFNHLFFNSIPLLVLSVLIISMNVWTFWWVTIFISLVSGLAVWLVGRRGNHIGASALIAGYFGYVLALAYEKPSVTSLFLGGITLYYFGGILLSVFPQQEKVSWEGHLLGMLSGILAMYLSEYQTWLMLGLFHPG
jgi:membrane associated rhomboid family serine protease